MVLEGLEGRRTSRGALRIVDVRAGRFPEERDAVLAVDADSPVARVKHFAGRPSAGVRPWIEAWVEPGDELLLAELVEALAELLPPGGYLMVGYGGDETERGLRRGVPPCATPLGKALYDAGCTWFKDWYYPEGWSEGGMKLQGNKPLTDELRRERLVELRAEVETWLTSAEVSADDLLARAGARARSVLGGRG